MREQVLHRFGWLGLLLAAIWGVELLNILTGYAFNRWFGLLPRSVGGLDGILFMPVLHGSVAHAAANTGPLVALGLVMAATIRRNLLAVNAVIVGLGGLGVWIFGAYAIHVGASGLIFGWFGFLVARGVIDRHPVTLLVAVAVAAVYGTMIWGVLPGQPGVSWEGHLFGALAGVAAAVILRAPTGGLRQ